MGDINKLLIGSETALATERVSNTDADEDQVAVVKKKLSEMSKKDQDAGQQIQHLSQRLKSKVTDHSHPTRCYPILTEL